MYIKHRTADTSWDSTVANAAPAAIGAVAEEPSCFGKAMIFVALGEGVALYGFLIAFLIIQALA